MVMWGDLWDLTAPSSPSIGVTWTSPADWGDLGVAAAAAPPSPVVAQTPKPPPTWGDLEEATALTPAPPEGPLDALAPLLVDALPPAHEKRGRGRPRKRPVEGADVGLALVPQHAPPAMCAVGLPAAVAKRRYRGLLDEVKVATSSDGSPLFLSQCFAGFMSRNPLASQVAAAAELGLLDKETSTAKDIKTFVNHLFSDDDMRHVSSSVLRSFTLGIPQKRCTRYMRLLMATCNLLDAEEVYTIERLLVLHLPQDTWAGRKRVSGSNCVLFG